MKLLKCLLLLVLGTTLVVALDAQASNLTVDCRPGAKGSNFTTITAAITSVTAQAAKKAMPPTTITVTGPCAENVLIVNLDNVTLQASPTGASITDASNGTVDTVIVESSNRFALNGFTINGSVDCVDNSACYLVGNTIQNSQIGWGLRASRAHVDSQSDSISNNPSASGVLSVNEARVVLVDDTISNNGGRGVQVTFGGYVLLAAASSTTTVSNNGDHGIFAAAHGTIRFQTANVTGNAGDGVRVQDDSVLRTDFVAPTVNNITGNGGAGVNIGDLSHAWFVPDGSMNITGNLGGLDVYCAGQFAATRNVGTVGGTTNCVEPNPEAPTQRPLGKERLKPF